MHAKESITNVYLTDSVFASGFEAHEVPVHRWSFESDASDSIGGADGTLVNGALVNAGQLELAGTSEYVSLPIASTLASLSDITIEAWLTVDIIQTWGRVFDFGTGLTTYLFVTPRSNTGNLRAAIIASGGAGEQLLDAASPLEPGVATHLTLTIDANANLATLYVDGVEVNNEPWTLNTAALGPLTNIWLGRSQYPDPYLDGRIDEFRIYNRVLCPKEVAKSHLTGPDEL